MSPLSQRVAIAESDGWSEVKPYAMPLPPPIIEEGQPEDPEYIIAGKHPLYSYVHSVPDYLNSRDAMHGAIETKWHDVTFRAKYAELLHAECGYVPCGSLHATAAQQAKCYLRALNLWDDSK